MHSVYGVKSLRCLPFHQGGAAHTRGKHSPFGPHLNFPEQIDGLGQNVLEKDSLVTTTVSFMSVFERQCGKLVLWLRGGRWWVVGGGCGRVTAGAP